ncbi:uracil-DNA glycosylase family protein [Paenibacillus azoreducens]|uniref:uracil-DNA glycosylase family protein n=1 Tax=Paenibacillus azoreducens TaxID=116718 RepID=UPI001F326C9F|nr:uracil-DNA glycosylase family protein [Paenibacillus azoreducens]
MDRTIVTSSTYPTYENREFLVERIDQDRSNLLPLHKIHPVHKNNSSLKIIFLCGTRETLQLGMMEAGIDIHSVYVTYLLIRRPIRAYNKPATRAACLHHLQLQLLQKQPSVLFGFGNVVSEALFPQKEDATVKALRGNWHEFERIPIRFTYHPLAVRRRSNLLRFFVEDLKALKEKWEGGATLEK